MRNHEFILLEGVENHNRFFTTNLNDTNPTCDGAYIILGYADTVEEAQLKLYGRTFPLDKTEPIVDYSKLIE